MINEQFARGRSRLVLAMATLAGRLAATASRVTGRGSGAAIKGATMLKIDRNALSKLLAGKHLAVVTGTNGKTTTTHFLTAAIRAGHSPSGADVVHNADGANLHGGITAALSDRPRASWAVIEGDERVVADLIRIGKPEVLVLLNLSRDQLDRNHEVKSLARSWRSALASAGQDGPVVVASADDPLIVWAARTARQVIWVNTGSTWIQDSSLCPQCDALLVRAHNEGSDDSGGAQWSCSECDLAQPHGAYQVMDEQIVDAADHTIEPQLLVPGGFNIGNAACALAAAGQMGVDSETAIAGMRTVTAPAGRFSTIQIGDTTARLLLAKNPAGWAAVLPMAQTGELVLAIDSAAADGRDVSWLWDVDYEQLAGRTVIATGPRAADLAVRLRYAEVEHRYVPDLAEALSGPPREVDVIASYTAFRRILKMGEL